MTVMLLLIYICLGLFFTYGFYQSSANYDLFESIIIGLFWPMVIVATIIASLGMLSSEIIDELNNSRKTR